MTAELELGPDETVPGKPFVDPVHTREDQEVMGRLLGNERERARFLADDWLEGRKDVIISETDPEGLRHLLVVPDTRALLDARNLTVVGFFGRPRLDADVTGPLRARGGAGCGHGGVRRRWSPQLLRPRVRQGGVRQSHPLRDTRRPGALAGEPGPPIGPSRSRLPTITRSGCIWERSRAGSSSPAL